MHKPTTSIREAWDRRKTRGHYCFSACCAKETPMRLRCNVWVKIYGAMLHGIQNRDTSTSFWHMPELFKIHIMPIIFHSSHCTLEADTPKNMKNAETVSCGSRDTPHSDILLVHLLHHPTRLLSIKNSVIFRECISSLCPRAFSNAFPVPQIPPVSAPRK